MIASIELTRDSVAAGDDCDAPHQRRVDLEPTSVAALQEMLQSIADDYLPSVAGPASWIAFSRVPLSIVSNEWRSPKAVWQIDDDVGALDVTDETLRLHFVYLGTTDPDVGFDVMLRLNSAIRR